jgi:hypothetical protein
MSTILCCTVQKGEQTLDTTTAAAAAALPSSSSSSSSTGFVADAVRTARATFERRYFSLSRQRQSRNGDSDAPDAVELKPLMADDVSTLSRQCSYCLHALLLVLCIDHARHWVLHSDSTSCLCDNWWSVFVRCRVHLESDIWSMQTLDSSSEQRCGCIASSRCATVLYCVCYYCCCWCYTGVLTTSTLYVSHCTAAG